MSYRTAKRVSKYRFFLLHGIISTVILVLVLLVPNRQPASVPGEYEKAARLMEQSLEMVSSYCIQKNININPINDPAKTGLIGPELTSLTTTTGTLEAKRSTINPNFAALILHWLQVGGVNRGDTIAIACSGSFPGLLIASLSAAKALDLHSKVILSMGASSYGATNPEFTLLDLYLCLQSNELADAESVAVSPGGIDDVGGEFPDSLIRKIRLAAREAGIPFLYEADLQNNIKLRWSFYKDHPHSSVKAFINCGGAQANLGTSPDILLLPPGLILSTDLPEVSKRGMIYAMLAEEIPVIHLLFIKGIVQEYGLTWDPVSIPEFDSGIVATDRDPSPFMLITGSVYLVYFLLILFWYHRLYNMK
jgi:poly-gamma-glutamate system protein